ncbi:uncharacterized protein LOC134767067 [Penaeus indicus]|uniref:uncharacterized protein LOC134767067 n=1 Tax=Penaeus indicus TaxID=29960 RepID=UPI00300DA053
MQVPREMVNWCLQKKGVPEYLINIVKDTYESVTIMVRTPQGTSEEFKVKVGLHQGSNLSPLLFIVTDVEVEEGTRESRAKSEHEEDCRHEKQQRTKKNKHQRGERRKVDEYMYLSSTMVSEGGYERAVKDRLKAAWAKWQEVSAVM